jgi:hypothetical protein
MIRVGLRFRRGDARVLRALAERVRAKELGAQAVATFAGAADAAATGEPLIVLCNDHTEAQVMADGYVRYGVRRPAVEELTGQRPAK